MPNRHEPWKSLRILVIDDKPEECKPFLAILKSDESPFEIEFADEARNIREAIGRLREKEYDLLILDISFGASADREGLAILKMIRSDDKFAHYPVVVLTNFSEEKVQEDFIQLGVDGFFAKQFDAVSSRLDSNIYVIKKSLKMGEIRKEYLTAEGIIKTGRDRISNVQLYGVSPVMRKIFHKLIMIAAEISTDNDYPGVLIIGETGTGKSSFARAIWTLSDRSDKPFEELVVNTIAEGVLESALFGHERGAFTGAYERTPGRFEQADGGVMFLDEIGELPETIQVKLLQVLRERRIRPMGGGRDIQVDFQLICDTNKDLETLIMQKKFRADLYHRIRGIEITVPPLRDRFIDCHQELDGMILREEELFKKCGRSFTFTLTKGAKELLLNHSWPGNYAEFKSLFYELSLLSCSVVDERMIKSRLLKPEFFFEGDREIDEYNYVYYMENYREATQEFQKAYLRYWLAQNDSNVTKTGKQLKVDPATIYRKLEEKRSSPDEKGQTS
jgi:DNA-binding NtrC family response regulator